MALDDFTHSLPMLLYRAIDAVMPRFRRIFNEFGITEQQWRVLRVLADAKSLSMRDLSEYCLIPPPSLVGIVDRMETAGYVAREASEKDRRVVRLRLTELGARLHLEVAPEVTATYSALMQSVSPRDWIQLTDGLADLSVRAQDDESRQD